MRWHTGTGRAAEKKSVSEREWKRKKGYELLRKGVRKADIARTLGVDWKTVRRWERRMENGGKTSWKDVKPPGKPSKLSVKQREALRKILIKGALARGYPTDLWTLKRVAEVIRQEFGVEYNVTHVWRVLRDMGFSPQVPLLVAKEKNDVLVNEWVKKEWPKIRTLARRNHAKILFLDESCVQSMPNARRTWAQAGARPVMRVKEGERNKLSLISAVSMDADLYFRMHTENITGTEIMEFLRYLLNEIEGSIVLLWDNGGPHRRVDVKESHKLLNYLFSTAFHISWRFMILLGQNRRVLQSGLFANHLNFHKERLLKPVLTDPFHPYSMQY